MRAVFLRFFCLECEIILDFYFPSTFCVYIPVCKQ